MFPLTTGAFEQAWKRPLVREGITGLTFHDLLHEAVSRLFDRGLNAVEVSTISGHRELRMLKRYAFCPPTIWLLVWLEARTD